MRLSELRVARLALLAFLAFLASVAGCRVAATRESWTLEGASDGGGAIRLSWAKNMLSIHRADLPGGKVDIWYLEAYCRSGSTDRDWHQTVIPHRSELIEASDRRIRIRCALPTDGGAEPWVTVDHEITASDDEVAFWVRAENHGSELVDAQWVQPCIRVADFTGRSQTDYQERSFIFTGEGLRKLTEIPRALEARYTPGQVFVPRGIDIRDVNPRPISAIIPANGMIGCFSAAGDQLLATAWEPYQELFQGVIVCLHSDFRLGGLAPGEVKIARGKVYLLRRAVGADARGSEAELAREALERYRRDFPEQ